MPMERKTELETTKFQENLEEKEKQYNEWESMNSDEIKKELRNIRWEEFNKADPLDLYGDFDDKTIKSLLRFKEIYERVKKAVQVLKQRGEEGWDNEDQKADHYAGNIKDNFWKDKTSVSAKKYYLDLIPKTADNKLNDDEISALKPEEGDWRAKVNSLVNEEKYSRLDVANLVTYGEDLLSLIKVEKNQKVFEAHVLQEPK